MLTTETLTLQTLPIALIDESPLNPRKTFDPAKLEELAASLRRSGMLEPVTVRPRGDRFELASGHRRVRAAQLAGLEEIPAHIRDLDDEAFMEMLTVANLQRENVHPLEEADAYHQMITALRWDVATIAKRVGKSERYVYDRLKFLSLAEEVRALFVADRLTAAHASELARIPLEAQLRAIDPAHDALWERTFVDPEQEVLFPEDDTYEVEGAAPFDEDQDAEQDQEDEDGDDDGRAFNLRATPVSSAYKLRTVAELHAWIQRHVYFHPAEADPLLFPETAGAFEAAVAAERKVVSITYSPQVHPDAKATGERIYGPQLWRDASTRGCEFAVLGVVAAGRHQSRAFDVCLKKDRCEIHWATEIRQKRAAAAAKDGTGATASRAEVAHVEQPYEKANREREERNAKAEAARGAVAAAVLVAFKKTPVSTLVDRLLELGVNQRPAADSESEVHALVKRGRSAEDQLRWLAWGQIADELMEDWDIHQRFLEIGKEFGVKVAPIIKAAQVVKTPAEPTPAKGRRAKAGA